MFALKHFDLSFAYTIWAGLGILLVSVMGMIYFKEPISMLKIISILIIVIGVVLLRNVDELTSTSRRTDLGRICSISDHKSSVC